MFMTACLLSIQHGVWCYQITQYQGKVGGLDLRGALFRLTEKTKDL